MKIREKWGIKLHLDLRNQRILACELDELLRSNPFSEVSEREREGRWRKKEKCCGLSVFLEIGHCFGGKWAHVVAGNGVWFGSVRPVQLMLHAFLCLFLYYTILWIWFSWPNTIWFDVCNVIDASVKKKVVTIKVCALIFYTRPSTLNSFLKPIYNSIKQIFDIKINKILRNTM